MVDAAESMNAKRKRHVLWVAVELGPEAQAGGLGEVTRALPPRLAQAGWKVSLCVPHHRGLRAVSMQRHGELLVAGHHFTLSKFERNGVDHYAFRCETLFDRPSIYASTDDDAYRYSVFTQAALQLGHQLGVDIVHAHDWHTAIAPVLLRYAAQANAQAQPKSVLTIHNAAHQGVTNSELVPALSLPWSVATEDGLGFGWQRINLLKGGVLAADRVTTVSQTHARDLLTEEGGFGLQDVFARARGGLLGIMNGIETSSWNPMSDPALSAPLGADIDEWKSLHKNFITQRLKTPMRAPLVCSIGRLVYQKGIDVLLDTISEGQIAAAFNWLVIGVGDVALEQQLQHLAQARGIRACLTYDESLSRQALAASDFFIMPSRFEPGGLAQLQALRYGAIPIVRRTGGLAESVIDMGDEQGNGICFSDATVTSLSHALARAKELYADRPRFQSLRQNALSSLVSWEQAVPSYEGLYESL